MTDPYEILGIPRDASEDEIKAAYRNLAKKYHPDNFAGAPDIASVAEDKMREVNEAYDAIIKGRKNGSGAAGGAGKSSSSGSEGKSSGARQEHTGGGSASSGGAASGAGATAGGSSKYSTTTEFPNIRNLIMAGRYDDADEVLNASPSEKRSAEWNFLKGTVLYRRGWLEQAYTYLQTAVNMDPNNYEYRAAYNQASGMRSGRGGGYKVSGNDGAGCSLCSSCCSLMCADQCCECFGGDLISCC